MADKVAIPFWNRLIVEREDKSVSKGGIILPDTAKKQRHKGIVRWVGHTCKPEVKALIGKEILFSRFGGDDMALDSDKPHDPDARIFLISDDDIMAIIAEPSEVGTWRSSIAANSESKTTFAGGEA